MREQAVRTWDFRNDDLYPVELEQGRNQPYHLDEVLILNGLDVVVEVLIYSNKRALQYASLP